MVTARERFLSGRHYEPIADAVAAAAGYAQIAAAGIAVELAAGTGYYLARLADAQPRGIGIAMDIARPALQRAARCHPRVVAVGWDVWRRLPIADRSVAVVLSVFGPRNALEIKRILRPGGAIVIVTPLPEHLNELRDPLGLVGIDPLKPSRLSASFDPVAQLESEVRCEYSIMLSRTDCLALAEMGPSAHHSTPAQLAERADRLDELTEVSVAVRVSTYRV
jgi:23S rRNA (guanine745-N1)-methyltransferase